MIKDHANQLTGGLNEAFPYKVCINLDRRPDRWHQMQLKFDRHGIHSVQRFPALDGNSLAIPANWIHTPGAYGCLVSHLQVVQKARRLGVSSVFIFEDDVVFDPRLQQKFRASIEQLPPHWDMLYFGALHKDEPIQVSEDIVRISAANSTYAYALRDTVFDDFIELNRRAETVLDNNSLVLQKRFNCYCFMPHLAWVDSDYSDAQERFEQHWYLRESLVLFGSRVDRLLSDTTVVFAYRDHTGDGRAARNMMFLVQYYNTFFLSYIDIVIVEQGAQPTINPVTLPTNCNYVFFQNEGPFDREACFELGIRNLNPKRKCVILSDNDIFLEAMDIRANLTMCQRYDYTTGFSEIIDLTDEASLRLRNTNTTRGIDITTNPWQKDNECQCYCRFFNREAIQIPGGRGEGGSGKIGPLLSLHAEQRFRVFQSPNRALRLK